MAAAVGIGGGSSPLTRGKPLADMTPAETRGLIPAHAGKTHYDNLQPQRSTAHPRSRGENENRVNGRVVGAGSSPLTRGKLHT